MRIRDWSSDVCSSDLGEVQEGVGPDELRVVDAAGARRHADRRVRRRAAERHDVRVGDDVAVRLEEDRKSVGSGKRVSVRVDLGGRRLITKKNNTQNTDYTYITHALETYEQITI